MVDSIIDHYIELMGVGGGILNISMRMCLLGVNLT